MGSVNLYHFPTTETDRTHGISMSIRVLAQGACVQVDKYISAELYSLIFSFDARHLDKKSKREQLQQLIYVYFLARCGPTALAEMCTPHWPPLQQAASSFFPLKSALQIEGYLFSSGEKETLCSSIVCGANPTQCGAVKPKRLAPNYRGI